MLPSVTSPSSRFLVGRYRLISLLGKGGMGTVWLASDDLLRQHVAIKEVRLPPDLDENMRAELRERTMREARAAAALRAHPSIVTVHDIVIEDERPWIVMELVQGRSLGQIIKEQGPLAPERVAGIGLRLLDALGAAHGAGILHRDIKPPNILITDDGRVVLTDFGIATLSGDPSLTQSGMLTGTPGFVAPERLRGEDDGPASDLWSLGATLFAAVEGRPPYMRERPTAVFAAVLMQDPDPMRLAGPLAPVLAGLLEKDPSQRLTREQAIHRLRPVADGTAPHPGGAPAHGHIAQGPSARPWEGSSGGAPATEPPEGGVPAATSHPGRGGAGPAAPSPMGPAGPGPAPANRKRPVLLGSVLAVVMVGAAAAATHGLWLDPPNGSGAHSTATPSGGGTTGRADKTANPSPTRAGQAAYRGDPEACKLITNPQATRLLGGTVKPRFQTHGSCMWLREDNGTFVNLTVTRMATVDFARSVFASISTTMEEEPRRQPGTRLRKRAPLGEENLSHTRGEVIVDTRIYRTQVLFRTGNMTVVVYTTLHSPGYEHPDQAARWVLKNLGAYR